MYFFRLFFVSCISVCKGVTNDTGAQAGMPVTAQSVKVIVADDHALIREGIRSLLDSLPNFHFIAEAGNWIQLERLLEETTADLLVLDLSMPGALDLDRIKMIKEQHPNLKILVVSMHPEHLYAVRCILAGADGYLNKGEGMEVLKHALEVVASGEPFIPPKVQKLLIKAKQAHEPHHTLSNREFEILLQLVNGKSTGEIAEAMHLSVKTVSTHRRRILNKLGLKTNAELMAYARAHRLIP